ncbi:MbtH family NRPS accessory protein [Aerophototrophica crusticola]|uniref:MbtH family NRPS accessory protein n=1 Tax=Aerophototrophica crusticola TaxID=1709002 RepID=A0A858R6N1_9PROT|nr:MbtH family NRPS accessory protein [Rhodospirillaceae bacterium B3]
MIKNGPFIVLVNDEEQYCLWQAEVEIPKGWRSAGQSGTREECLSFVDGVWSDMRPKSLRDTLANPA